MVSLRILVTIVVNLFLGFIVILVGLMMLPSYLSIVWGLFNAWLWIASPIIFLYANKKEKEKEKHVV